MTSGEFEDVNRRHRDYFCAPGQLGQVKEKEKREPLIRNIDMIINIFFIYSSFLNLF